MHCNKNCKCHLEQHCRILIEAFNFHCKNTKRFPELYSESSKTSAILKAKLFLQEKWRHRSLALPVSSNTSFCGHSSQSSSPPCFPTISSLHLYLPSCKSTHSLNISHPLLPLTYPVWHMHMYVPPVSLFQHECGLYYFFYYCYMYVCAHAYSYECIIP